MPHNLSLNNKFNHNINDFLKHFHAMPTKKRNERKFAPLDNIA